MTSSRAPSLSRRDLLQRGALALCAASLPPIRLQAQAISPVMATLSAYMAAAKDRGLPPEVVEKAKHHILDTFAAMISGSELPPGRAALTLARAQAGRPVATVVGSSVLTGPMDAALVNGVLAHSDETDDSHGPSQSHPGASIVPAALALGEDLGTSGEHFLRAVTLGYDVGPRLTMALGGPTFRDESRRSTHAFAGNFGSAAAAGCVAGLTAQQMRWLLDYASQQAVGICDLGPRHGPHRKGIRLRRHAGAQRRHRRRLLVRSGWNGVDDVFSGADNFFQVNAPKGNPAVLIDKLGRAVRDREHRHQEVDGRHPDSGAAWTPSSSSDASGRSTPNDVTRVVVRLAPIVGAVVDNRDIPDICLQHMVAVMLIDKTASFHAAHDKARMQDAEVLRQRAKVTYTPTPR